MCSVVKQFSILLMFVREISGFHVGAILLDGTLDLVEQFQVSPQKTGLEIFRNAEHVVSNQYLPIGMNACTDSDGRDHETF